MIKQLSRDIEASLRARNYPVRVAYGPERLGRGAQAGQAFILFERDRQSGDGFRHVQAARGPAQQVKFIRDLGVVVHVYAASSAASARTEEHEHVTDQIVDALGVALFEWFAAAKTGQEPVFSESKMLDASELESDEMRAWPGCVYRMRFDLPRGVRALDWTHPREHAPGTVHGEPRPTATVARFGGGEAHLRRQAGDPDEPAEVVEIPEDPIDP